MSMTTKEWVIPPRPKPGRKPATDTPPTKRKAQNRAAQRAFRERRAARVGELEEQLEEQREERDKVENGFKEKIRLLELEVESFRSKCSLLENLLERERQERSRVQTELGSLRRTHEAAYERNHSRGTGGSISSAPDGLPYVPQGQDSSHFNHQRQVQPVGAGIPSHGQQLMNGFQISQIVSPPDPTDSMNDTDLTCGNCQPSGPCACAEEALRSVQEETGCGKCSFGTDCQCIEETLQAVSAPLPTSKRALSPFGASPQEKRIKSITAQPFADASLSNPTSRLPPPSVISPMRPKDTCGFCDEGSYCVCADTALAANLPAPVTATNTMGSVISHETQAPSPPAEVDIIPLPPPMEITSTGAVKLRPRGTQRKKLESLRPTTSVVSANGNMGPGTCKQCLEDPQSGLFCRTLASLNGGGCCGGNTGGGGGGCCKTKGASGQGGGRPVTINCAETYKTLSSHQNFDRAFEDLGAWLPKLKLVPRKDDVAATAGRPTVEIDAASIMSTLKFLDVRFGSSDK